MYKLPVLIANECLEITIACNSQGLSTTDKFHGGGNRCIFREDTHVNHRPTAGTCQPSIHSQRGTRPRNTRSPHHNRPIGTPSIIKDLLRLYN